MGSRAYATLVYGFTLNDEDMERIGDDFGDRQDAWRDQVLVDAGHVKPDRPNKPYHEWPDEEREAHRVAATRERELLRVCAKPIEWGALYEGYNNYALGIVVAASDCEVVKVVPSLDVPSSAIERIAKAAEFFGVEMRECQWLLLASYG